MSRNRTPERRRPARSRLRGRKLEVVKTVSFAVAPGEIVGIVGESGSGKTLAARAIMGLMPPAIQRTAGSDPVRGQGRHQAVAARNCAICAAPRIGMVFQEPMTSLNPSMTIGRQLDEGLALHRDLDARRAPQAGSRHAHARRDPRPRRRADRLSAPVLRRHAPAHHAGVGDAAQAGAARSPTSRPRRSMPWFSATCWN